MARIGVIADTHGLLRPEVFEVFREVDHILHAGDVGPTSILDELGTIAPVTAVYGNTDGLEVRARLPAIATVELDGFTHRRHPRRQARQPDARAATGRVPRRRDHRLRPHPPPPAHAGRCRRDRDEPGRCRAAALRPAGLRGHPGARAGHPTARPSGPADTAGSGIAAARLRRFTAASAAGLALGTAGIRHAPAPRHRAASGGGRAHRQRGLGSAPAAHRYGARPGVGLAPPSGGHGIRGGRGAGPLSIVGGCRGGVLRHHGRSGGGPGARRFPVVAPAGARQQRGLSRAGRTMGTAARRPGLAARCGADGWRLGGERGGRRDDVVVRAAPRPGLARGRAGTSARHRVPDSRRRSQPLVQLASGHVAGRG